MKSDIITLEEFKKIKKLLQPANALALETAAKTGLRIGDVLQLKTDNINDNLIHYVAQKTGKSGTAKIPQGLKTRLLNNAVNGWLFPGRNPKKHRTRQAVFTDMTKAAKRLNLQHHATPHSTRKLFAVETLNKKGFNATMQALQHSNPNITRLYCYDEKSDTRPPAWAYVIADYIIDKIADMLNIPAKP